MIQAALGASLGEAVDLHPDVTIIQTNRHAGNMELRFTDLQSIKLAHQIIREAAGNPATVCNIRAVAGVDFTDLSNVGPEDKIAYDPDLEEVAVTGDGLITLDASVGLMLNGGDCMPMTVFQPEQRLLALIHCGWRGVVSGIQNHMLEYMKGRYGFRPETALAHLGPNVQQPSALTYTLDGRQRTAAWRPFIERSARGYLVDLPGFVTQSLVDHGLKRENIMVSPVDTGADPDYFSFVRSKQTGEPEGRNGYLVVMNK